MKFTGTTLSALSLGSLLLAIPAMAAGNPDRGKAVFARCAACHSMDPAKKMIGPSLANVVGRKAGSIEGYIFSPAIKKYGKVWDAKLIETFLAAPMKTVPGTKMIFAGLSDPNDRENIIAYLRAASK